MSKILFWICCLRRDRPCNCPRSKNRMLRTGLGHPSVFPFRGYPSRCLLLVSTVKTPSSNRALPCYLCWLRTRIRCSPRCHLVCPCRHLACPCTHPVRNVCLPACGRKTRCWTPEHPGLRSGMIRDVIRESVKALYAVGSSQL